MALIDGDGASGKEVATDMQAQVTRAKTGEFDNIVTVEVDGGRRPSPPHAVNPFTRLGLHVASLEVRASR